MQNSLLLLLYASHALSIHLPRITTFGFTSHLVANPGATYLHDLSNWVPSSTTDIALVTIRCLRALHEFHSRKWLHGDVALSAFLYNDDPTQLVLYGGFAMLDHKDFLGKEVKELLKLSAKWYETLSPEMPRELQLCFLKLGRPYSSSLLPDMVGVLNRLILAINDQYDSVRKYHALLTAEEGMLLTADTPFDLSTCHIPRVTSIENIKGSFIMPTRSLISGTTIVARNLARPLSLYIRVEQDAMKAIRESAILSLLRDLPVEEVLPTPAGFPSSCQQHISVNLRHWLDLPLGKQSMSANELTLFTITAMQILQSVHEKGFVHGNIGINSFVLIRGRLSKNYTKLRLIDFSHASTWLTLFAPPNRPTRLGDVAKLCELVFRLSGQSETEELLVPGYRRAVVSIFETITTMDLDDEPLYDAWITSMRV